MLSIVASAKRPTPSFKRRQNELKKITKSLRTIAKDERARFSTLVKEHREMFNNKRGDDDEKDVKIPEIVDMDSYFNDEE